MYLFVSAYESMVNQLFLGEDDLSSQAHCRTHKTSTGVLIKQSNCDPLKYLGKDDLSNQAHCRTHKTFCFTTGVLIKLWPAEISVGRRPEQQAHCHTHKTIAGVLIKQSNCDPLIYLGKDDLSSQAHCRTHKTLCFSTGVLIKQPNCDPIKYLTQPLQNSVGAGLLRRVILSVDPGQFLKANSLLLSNVYLWCERGGVGWAIVIRGFDVTYK